MEKTSRFGAYGIINRNNSLLLCQKKSGPFKGKWDLPGGRIEFGESPEETLLREILEETAHKALDLTLNTILTTSGNHNGLPFHYIGIIYTISQVIPQPTQPEELFQWFPLDTLDKETLTPFARQVTNNQTFTTGPT